jgi:hypothetical protein
MLCEAVQQWAEQAPHSAELLMVYGGMTSQDVEWILRHRHPASRIFWLDNHHPALSDCLDTAVVAGDVVVTPVNERAIELFFSLYDPKADLAFTLLNARRTPESDQLLCEEFMRGLHEQLRMDVFNAGTLVTKGPLWQNNTLQNLPYILRNPGVSVLTDCFKGRPAIVAGAGPSLTAAIPYLKKVKDQVVIISTGTALAPLRQAGIRPDLVIAVDGSPLIGKQFKQPCEDLYLVGSTLVYPGIPGLFKGLFFSLLDFSPIDQWVKQISAVDGRLSAGGTVTACGMDLAVTMGCNPVVTVGLDLAYGDDGGSHADGTMYHGVKQARNGLMPVPGNWQDEVYTTRQFSCYIQLVKQYVESRATTQFINVTNGGARIGGMNLQPIIYLEGPFGEAFDARQIIEDLHRTHLPAEPETAEKNLREIADYLESVQSHCRNGAMASNRLLLMQRRPDRVHPDEMRACLQVLRDTDAVLEKSGEGDYDFLKMSLWPAAYELASKPQESERHYSSESERNLSRSRRFYEQTAGAAKWTRQLVLRACRIPAKNDSPKILITTTGECDG